MQVDVLKRCLGLNTRDHPTELYTEAGVYLSAAVNVDITDEYSVKRRDGFTTLADGYTKAHSLTSFLDRHLIFADGANLYCYTISGGGVSVIKTDLTPDKPLSYAPVAEMLAFTNGVERGVVVDSGVGLVCTDYFPFVADPSQVDREISEFPLTDKLSFFDGSMYGGVVGANFLYCSEPYKPNHYDQIKGYISLTGEFRFVTHVEGGVVVGSSDGVVAYAGHGLGDFTERVISTSPALLCSEYTSARFSPDISPAPIKGVFLLCANGISFLTDQFEQIELTAKLDLDWSKVSAGAFGQIKNNYIFSGVIK